MLHSVSNNKLRRLRIITNPNVQLREPFNFARVDPSQYSVVEMCTIQALGSENLKSWRVTGTREMIEVERDSDKDDRADQERNVLPRLRRSSSSSGRSSSSHASESSNGNDGSGSDRSSSSAEKYYRRETSMEAGKNFLKGVLNPKRFAR